MASQVAELDGVNCLVDSATPTVPITDVAGDGGDIVVQNASVLRDHNRYRNIVSIHLAASDSSDAAKFRATSDYTCDGTDDQVEIQAAIDAVNTAGGGIVLLAAGTYTITDSIAMKSNVWMCGEGWATIIEGVEDPAATAWSLIDGSNISNIAICNMKLDASGVRSASFLVGNKCIFTTSVDRGLLKNLWCHGSAATAIGADLLRDFVIADCLVTDFGQQHTTGNVGGNGIGIGTGTLTGGERVLISNCSTRNSGGAGNNGIMFESQGSGQSVKGEYHIVNCSTSGSEAGFRASGCPDLTLTNFQATGCVDGIRISAGLASSEPASGLVISGGVIRNNSEAGIKFLHNSGTRHHDISISNVQCLENGTDGIRLEDCAQVSIANVNCRGNGRAGISLLPANGGDVEYVTINGGECSNNGTDTGLTSTQRAGLWLGLSAKTINRISVANLRVYDDQGTKTQLHGIRLDGTVNNLTVSDCDLEGNDTGPLSDGSTAASGNIFRHNRGYITHNYGSESVSPDANGEGTIAHGCSDTPTFANVSIGGDTANSVDVVSIDGTNVTVRIKDASGSDVTAGSFTVYWEARV